MWVQSFAVNHITQILMVTGMIGVVRSLRTSRLVHPTCPGTVFNRPMSVVTMIKDAGMAVIALASLLAVRF